MEEYKSKLNKALELYSEKRYEDSYAYFIELVNMGYCRPEIMMILGGMYYNGVGCEKDEVKAGKLYGKVANQGWNSAKQIIEIDYARINEALNESHTKSVTGESLVANDERTDHPSESDKASDKTRKMVKQSKALIVLCMFVAVFLIAGGMILFLVNKDKEDKNREKTETLNTGAQVENTASGEDNSEEKSDMQSNSSESSNEQENSPKIRYLENKEAVYDSNNILISSTQYVYDEQGNLFKIITYAADGTLTYYEEFLYDENGNVAKKNKYDAVGTLIEWIECFYEKEHNKKIKQIRYNADGSIKDMYTVDRIYEGSVHVGTQTQYDGNGNVLYTMRYDIDYLGNMHKCETYNSENELTEEREYVYDYLGNESKCTYYSSEGKVMKVEESNYDENGNRCEIITYLGTGNIWQTTIIDYTLFP